MTAHPDLPDTPDRTDAIARVLADAGPANLRVRYWNLYRDDADAILATDDPAAVAAIAAQWAERHPEALLTALTNAGVLRAKYAVREVNGDIWLDAHGIGPEAKPGGLEHDHRDDAETICAGPPDEAVVGRLVTRWREVQQP